MKSYIIIIYEYFKSVERSHLIWNFTISIILSATTFYFLTKNNDTETAKSLINNSASVLGILVGFSVSMFTLVTTVSNENIEHIKKVEIGKFIFNKPIYLYDLLLVGLIYIVMGESLSLIFNLLFPFYFSVQTPSGKIAFAIDVFFIVHFILANLNTVTSFYFVISKKN